MSKEIGVIHLEILPLVRNWLLIILSSRLRKHARFISSYGAIIEDSLVRLSPITGKNDLVAQLQKNKTFKSRLLSLVAKDIGKIRFGEFTSDFRDYYMLVENIAESVYLEPVPDENMMSCETDNAIRNISHYYLSSQLSSALFDVFVLCYRKIYDSSIELWKIDDQIDQKLVELVLEDNDPEILVKKINMSSSRDDIRRLSESVKNYSDNLDQTANSLIERVVSEYEDAVNHIENADNQLTSADETVLAKRKAELNKSYIDLNNLWISRLLVLADNWKKNQWLKSLNIQALKESVRLQHDINNYYSGKLLPAFRSVGDAVTRFFSEFKKLPDVHEKFLPGLATLRNYFEKEIQGSAIPDVMKILALHDVITALDKTEVKVNRIISGISHFESMENIQEPPLSSEKNLSLFERVVIRFMPHYSLDLIMLKREITGNMQQNVKYLIELEETISRKLLLTQSVKDIKPDSISVFKKQLEVVSDGLHEKYELILQDIKEINNFISKEHIRSVTLLLSRVNEMISAVKFENYQI